jgi:hypothetical protein
LFGHSVYLETMPAKTKRASLIVGLAVLMVGATAYSKGVSFPGRDSCNSPRKSWKVICKEEKVLEGSFQLMLRNSKDATEQEIFDGGRWCEVLWSRDEAHFAITDWAGSNFSDVLFQDPKAAGPAKSLRDVINMAAVRARVSEDELRGHCYWEALNWELDGRLRFRIFGHTDTKKSREFTHTFLVKLPEGTLTVPGSTGPDRQGGVSGRQPFSSETNRTPAAAGSRRSP